MFNEQSETDDTKKRLVKVALDLFATYGFDGVSTRQIAKEANCNIASLNYHYGTKRKLYYECLLAMEPKTDFGISEILVCPRNRADFESRLCKFCEAFSEYVIEHASSLKLLINEINLDNKDSIRDAFLEPVTKNFEAFFKAAQEKLIISGNADPAIFTRMIMAVIISQKLFKSFKPFTDISNQDLATKLIKTVTGELYV